MNKNGLLFLMLTMVMILSSCSTNSAKETEFTNEGIFCDLPSCLYNADDSVYAASDKVAAFVQAFPAQKMLETLDKMKSKKFRVTKYDGEKTDDAQILKLSSMNQLFIVEMKIPFKEFPDNCVMAYYDADDKVVALDLPSISDDVEEEANVSSLFYGYPQVDQENVLLGMKAFWLAYDKVVRAEIVHSDSLDAFTEKAQDYMSHVYQKLVEESNAKNDDDDFDDEDSKVSSKSETPVKEGIFGDIPDLFEQQIRFNCQHEFYPSQLRNEEMDKIVTPDKVQKVKDQILTKHIHTIDEEGLTKREAYIGWVQYENHYFSVNINVPVVDENVPIKAEFCDVNGNVLYTSYPTGNPEMGNVIINRGFLSIGSPASQEERLVEDAREAKKVAQVRIVRAKRR